MVCYQLITSRPGTCWKVRHLFTFHNKSQKTFCEIILCSFKGAFILYLKMFYKQETDLGINFPRIPFEKQSSQLYSLFSFLVFLELHHKL